VRRTVRAVASHLYLVSIPDGNAVKTLAEIRMRIFLRLMGVECSLIALGELVLTKQVENLLAPFSAFEQEIIRTRYGLTDGREQEKLQTIGDDYNVTRERIRQIEARALHRIRSLAISLLQRRPDLSPQAS